MRSLPVENLCVIASRSKLGQGYEVRRAALGLIVPHQASEAEATRRLVLIHFHIPWITVATLISSSGLSFLPNYECIQRRTPRLWFQIRKELLG